MEQAKIHFRGGSMAPFSKTLNERVNKYFKEHGLKKTGNWTLYRKTIILFAVLIACYALAVFFIPPSPWSVGISVILGLSFAGIGFCVMHDANHESYSTNRKVNEMLSLSLNLLGGINFFWTEKHNQNHHSFTNVDGKDEDIDFGPLVRMSPHQKHHWWHRFQAFYLIPLYAVFYFGWIFLLDPIRYAKKWREGKLDAGKHLNFWVTKIAYVFVWLVFPIMWLGPVALVGYAVAGLTCSVVISFVFQLAHVVDGTEFIEPDEHGALPFEFAVHQVKTTNNFSRKNKLITWFVGGLNYQIEHHLFPRISHVHYPKISKIVKECCEEYRVRYNSSKTIWHAVWAHLTHLHRLGLG